MTALAHKEQPLLGAIVGTDIATARARLASVISVHFHAQRPSQDRLVVQEAAQLRKRPLGGVLNSSVCGPTFVWLPGEGRSRPNPHGREGRHNPTNQELPRVMVGESLGFSRREDVNS